MIQPQDELKPEFVAVGDSGVLANFGHRIDDRIHQAVLNLDAAIKDASITGLTEAIPAYAALLVGYDPLQTDFDSVCESLRQCASQNALVLAESALWDIPVCYQGDFAPDMSALSAELNLPTDEIIQHHSAAEYKVYMYGFAPGYAYLGGTPEAIQVPRKQAPVDNLPGGSVIIAGPQSLITTLPMPSGWWNIGRAVRTPLQYDQPNPFLFNVGDRVRFTPISEAQFRQQIALESPVE